MSGTVTLTPEKAVAVWSFVDSVKTPAYQQLPSLEKRLAILPGAEQRKLLPDA